MNAPAEPEEQTAAIAAARLRSTLLCIGIPLLLAGGLTSLPFSGWELALSLTASGLVVIVHVLWLERFLARVGAGASPRLRYRDRLKIFLQALLLTAAVATAYLWSGFSPAGAAIGVTLTVVAVGIAGAATAS